MSDKEDMVKEQSWIVTVYGEAVQQSISFSQMVTQFRMKDSSQENSYVKFILH